MYADRPASVLAVATCTLRVPIFTESCALVVLHCEVLTFVSLTGRTVYFHSRSLVCLVDCVFQGFRNYAFFPANYALFFGELCAKNPELCRNYANCAIFLSLSL